MRQRQHYAKLDTCKLALNTCADILSAPPGHLYTEKVVTAANALIERSLVTISDAIIHTDFEELESDEED